jgi:hypothetical protein
MSMMEHALQQTNKYVFLWNVTNTRCRLKFETTHAQSSDDSTIIYAIIGACCGVVCCLIVAAVVIVKIRLQSNNDNDVSMSTSTQNQEFVSARPADANVSPVLSSLLRAVVGYRQLSQLTCFYIVDDIFIRSISGIIKQL